MEFTVTTGFGRGDCGKSFTIGNHYLLLKKPFVNQFRTGICANDFVENQEWIDSNKGS